MPYAFRDTLMHEVEVFATLRLGIRGRVAIRPIPLPRRLTLGPPPPFYEMHNLVYIVQSAGGCPLTRFA